MCYAMLKMRLIGIDYGTKRVGIALSDDEGRLAFPYAILPQNENLSKKIKELCEKETVGAIVIGESRDFKGQENPIMPAVRVLKSALERETGLPVHFEPEMLTSRQARRTPERQEKVRRRQRRRRERARKTPERMAVDASAAALILQGYIDRQENKL